MNRLKTLRKQRRLTQAQLAKNLNVSLKALQLWEQGKSEPVLSNALKVATYFDVNVKELADADEVTA